MVKLRLSDWKPVETGLGTKSEAELKMLVKKCNKLRLIGSNDNAMLSNDVLASVGESCKDLETLAVAGCPLITAVGLGFVASHCKKLRTVLIRYGLEDRNSLRTLYPNIFWNEMDEWMDG